MSISWYSINIVSSPSNTTILNGFFSTDSSTNILNGFYETIGGVTDFSNNILETSGTYVKMTSGFAVYKNNNILFDNAFVSGWKGFTVTGIILKSMSYFPSGVNYNISADNLGDQLITTFSRVYSDSSVSIGLVEVEQVNLNISPISSPISNICFPAKTPILTDQGLINIEKIIPGLHTIRNKNIIGITKTITQHNSLVCFDKDSLANNIPSEKTIISRNHKILYKGRMIQAKHFVNKIDNVYRVKYKGEILYNVLMDEHDKMIVNNLVCETLDPTSDIAKLHLLLETLNPEQKNYLVNEFNKIKIEHQLNNKKLTK